MKGVVRRPPPLIHILRKGEEVCYTAAFGIFLLNSMTNCCQLKNFSMARHESFEQGEKFLTLPIPKYLNTGIIQWRVHKFRNSATSAKGKTEIDIIAFDIFDPNEAFNNSLHNYRPGDKTYDAVIHINLSLCSLVRRSWEPYECSPAGSKSPGHKFSIDAL